MRRRILGLAVGVTALVLLASSGPLAVLIYQSVQNKALDEARFEAENLAYYISAEDPDGDHVADYLSHVDGRYTGTTWVDFPDGSVVGKVPAAWADRGPGGPVGGDGDADHDGNIGDVSAASVESLPDGTVTSVQAVTTHGPSTVHTYLDDDQMHRGLAVRLLILGLVSAALLLLSLAGAEVVSRRLTRPLERAANTAARLSRGDMAARAPEDGPAEVAQVGVALNRLADRIDEVIAVEREAVADLSHRLRTPLTALRLDVDALDDKEASAALGAQVTTLERTLTSIIHAARRPQREGRVPRCDATAVVAARTTFWMPLAEEQGRTFSVSLPDRPLLVRSAEEDLAAAVDALIENVIAHTPEGVDLAVALAAGNRRDSRAVLTVSDWGPGIPPGAGRRGASDRGSTGLGLDIARRSAELGGGEIRVWANTPRGSVVELRFVTT